ncbi:hypothetical protein F66182_18413, partial [Fusarium sp. NRRL 66182]
MKAGEEIAAKHTPSSNAGLFAGVVDTAVAAAAGEIPAEVAQPGLARDINQQEGTVQEQNAAEIPIIEEESKAVAEETSSGTSKKQKRKDKKKKKKSKDFDAPAEDNDEGEATTASVPLVELDSSARPEPVPGSEAGRAVPVTETFDEPVVAEQQPISEEVEVKD